jgi:hypothetical protein
MLLMTMAMALTMGGAAPLVLSLVAEVPNTRREGLLNVRLCGDPVSCARSI